MRASAAVSLPIYAINLQEFTIDQNPLNWVKTKNKKHITSFIFPIPEIIDVVTAWHDFISARLPNSCPWYPVIVNHWGEQEFSNRAGGKNRNQSLNKRLRMLANNANIPYKSAHNFRRGHVVFVGQKAEKMGELKLISQHIGHSNISITDEYYSQITKNDLIKRMQKFMKKFEDFKDANYQPD